MSKKRLLFLTAILLIGFVIIGCENGTNGLQISTVRWELGADGFTQFYTNDSQDYSRVFWSIYGNDKKDSFEIECKRISGVQSTAYGMVFGVPDSDNSQYYYLLITNNGYYLLGKRTSDEYQTISDWTRSDKLFTGYNKSNILKVSRSGALYTIFLNGNQVYQFTDSSISGSRVGFYAAVSSEANEDFPNSPVDVRFRIK
jgi:hypothetical protein